MNAAQLCRQARPQDAALTDEDVVERVLAGETELFEILMRRHNQRLFRVARGIVRDATEAEDVAQEAYVRAYRELARFRGEARFSTWLTKIAVHEALARARRGRRFAVVPDEQLEASPTPAPDPEREAERHELNRVLQDAVERLPDALRPVFVLREVEGLSSEETSEALGISAGNVRVRLHRAKTQLRQELDARLGREVRRLYSFDGARCDRLVEAVLRRIAGG